MKAGTYTFKYRDYLDSVMCYKRFECNTMEDIKKAISVISRSYGEFEEYDRVLTNEEWYEQKRLYEEQEQNEA
jgi:hypothetical protein